MPQLPALTDEVLPPERSARRVAPAYRVTERRSDGFSFARAGVSTKIVLDDQMLRWATSERVTQEFLDRMARLRNLERKAPRGDSHGSWQKVAEVPYNWLFAKVPELEDEKAVARLLNNFDYRKLRCDGTHRRL